MRPPPVAGEAHTGRRCDSASSTAASQPPLASISGPATNTGRSRRCAAARRARRPAAGSACARAADRARDLRGESIGVDLLAPVVHRDRHERGSRGGSVAWWIACASANGTSAARGGSWLHFTYGFGTSTASRLVRLACIVDQRARLLAGGDQQRRLVRARVEDRARRRCRRRGRCAGSRARRCRSPARSRRPCPPRPPPAGRARSGSPRGSRAEHRQLGRAGVAEDRRHPARAEQLERGFADGRHAALLSLPVGGRAVYRPALGALRDCARAQPARQPPYRPTIYGWRAC